ncbi:tol-pal system protein YbgF [Alteromonas sediminis]|uniref:Cell division coordinator CpoB n=1 Tax=Alteromonas sediminis TaxID=2259342 RepID=A0A3N5Y4P0_9ALTE|nr:tol-pal system protein YbgF [Alteromonas sediminis]RPJ68560.1 tol-pal system protein YbgF [Alteromonas sediminis]
MKHYVRGKALSLAFVLSTPAALAQAPVSDLSTQSVQTQSAIGQNVGSLEDRVAVLERIIKSRTTMQQRLQQQLDTMQGEVDELRGAVELHTNQLEKVLQRQRELYLEIDKRVEALKQAETANAGSVTTPVANTGGVATTQPTVLSESEAYDAAVNLILKTKEYDKAIPAFERFLEAYPQSDYADNAHYWLGQLLFNQQQWEPSRRSFATVVDAFAQSSKRAEAMVKLGLIAQRTGDGNTAKNWFERVVAEYPNTTAAKLAASNLR